MKENVKKILLFLYTDGIQPPFFASTSIMQLMLPQMSNSGLRSLLSMLKKTSFIAVERIDEETRYRITTNGAKALKTAFPVLNEQIVSGWTGLVFRQAPVGDAQFRYLRTLLSRFQSIPLTRGVYVYPGSFPAVIEQEIDKRYRGSVSLFEIKKWLSDDERQIAIEHYGLSDLLQTYSGISKEIDRLINAKKSNMDLNQQEKTHISSLFNRLYENMREDMGLLPIYFPQVRSGKTILIQVQRFFSN